MMLFRKILLAIDSDGLCSYAAEAATLIARSTGAEVVVLHVGSPGDPSRLAEQTASELRARGVPAQALDRSGRSVADLVGEASAEFGAGLVVLGTHARSSLGAAVHHSLSRTASAHLDAPVLLVPRRPDARLGLHRILVAIDRGPQATATLELAADLARLQLAGIMVVHALDFLPYEDPLTEPDRSRVGEEILEAAATSLRTRHLSVETVLLPNEVGIAREIALVARDWKADIIVTGSRRPGSWGSLLLGSVSQEVLHLSQLPMMLAPRPQCVSTLRQREPAATLSER